MDFRDKAVLMKEVEDWVNFNLPGADCWKPLRSYFESYMKAMLESSAISDELEGIQSYMDPFYEFNVGSEEVAEGRSRVPKFGGRWIFFSFLSGLTRQYLGDSRLMGIVAYSLRRKDKRLMEMVFQDVINFSGASIVFGQLEAFPGYVKMDGEVVGGGLDSGEMDSYYTMDYDAGVKNAIWVIIPFTVNVRYQRNSKLLPLSEVRTVLFRYYDLIEVVKPVRLALVFIYTPEIYYSRWYGTRNEKSWIGNAGLTVVSTPYDISLDGSTLLHADQVDILDEMSIEEFNRHYITVSDVGVVVTSFIDFADRLRFMELHFASVPDEVHFVFGGGGEYGGVVMDDIVLRVDSGIIPETSGAAFYAVQIWLDLSVSAEVEVYNVQVVEAARAPNVFGSLRMGSKSVGSGDVVLGNVVYTTVSGGRYLRVPVSNWEGSCDNRNVVVTSIELSVALGGLVSLEEEGVGGGGIIVIPLLLETPDISGRIWVGVIPNGGLVTTPASVYYDYVPGEV